MRSDVEKARKVKEMVTSEIDQMDLKLESSIIKSDIRRLQSKNLP